MAKKLVKSLGVFSLPSGKMLLDTYILRKSRNKKDKYSFDLQLVGDTTNLHTTKNDRPPKKLVFV